jgi:hypothetical protein
LEIDDASWVEFHKLQKDFPDLEGKVFWGGKDCHGSVRMWL